MELTADDNYLDGDPYEGLSDQCSVCKHFTEGWTPIEARCAAFDLIPPEIWSGEVSHKKPYLGDRGIQFEHFLGEE